MHEAFLKATVFCDHEAPGIRTLIDALNAPSPDPEPFAQRAFYYVRDKIRFGADLWQVKASQTLKKGYGACFNKNLLLVAILRQRGIPAQLAAHPMKKTFARPNAGAGHRLFSTPFYHCFTRAWSRGAWIDLDPTLDRDNFETFFTPGNVEWGIDWHPTGMPPLYPDSIMGEAVVFEDIDAALTANLNSWFMFKHEPNILLKPWLWLGNQRMWRKMARG